MCHPVRKSRELQYGLGYLIGHEPHSYSADDGYQKTYIEHEFGSELGALPYALQRSPDEYEIPAAHITPELYIVVSHGRIRADGYFVALVRA